MKPGRDNYEIWITDWLDGNLSAADEALLMSFLEANPDIKQEAEELRDLMPAKSVNRNFDFSSLKKNAGDLSMNQVEYLSVACLENDLSAEQAADLKICIVENPEAKKTFDRIQKIKLIPPSVAYSGKRSLKKFVITPALVVRLSVTAISAAAAVALFLVLNNSQETVVTTPGLVASATTQAPETIQNNVSEPVTSVKPETYPVKTSVATPAGTEVSKTPVESVTPEIVAETAQPETITTPILPVDAPYLGNIALYDISVLQLAGYTNQTTPLLAYDDGSNRIERFVRRVFREEILKEDANTAEPLKAYEVAEAGIEGLNRLLGWEMALVKNNDEQGELESVYFSSSLIKFTAPAK